MADNEFGGRVTFEFDGVRIPPADGNFVLDPTNVSTEAKANGDGSAAFMSKPKLPGCDMKLRNVGDIDWNAMLRKQGNATIVEKDTGRTHLFTGAKLVGTPKVNLAEGEVDGLRVEGGNYQRV